MSIDYRETHDVDLTQLAQLKELAGWSNANDPERLRRQVEGARWVVSAWVGDRMIGFARAISDGVTNAYVSRVVAHSEYRGRGVGRELMRAGVFF